MLEIFWADIREKSNAQKVSLLPQSSSHVQIFVVILATCNSVCFVLFVFLPEKAHEAAFSAGFKIKTCLYISHFENICLALAVHNSQMF